MLLQHLKKRRVFRDADSRLLYLTRGKLAVTPQNTAGDHQMGTEEHLGTRKLESTVEHHSTTRSEGLYQSDVV